MLEIKILGSGCPNCKRLEQITRKAIENSSVSANIEKVTDVTKFIDYGVMQTPGLVINGKVVSSGRIPSEDEISAWIEQAI